jgi:hypothetical protein
MAECCFNIPFKVSLGALDLNITLRKILNGGNLTLRSLKLNFKRRKVLNRGALNGSCTVS